MALFSVLSMLALRPIVEGAIDFIENKTDLPIKDKVEATFSFLVDHFQDHSGRLTAALTGANERAWRTLEIALAGESLRTLLDRQEDKAFRAQIRSALDANPLNEVVGDDAEFRRACLVELRDARRKGQLTDKGPLEPESLFHQASQFARFDQPARLLDAEWLALDQLAEAIRADSPNLSRLLGHRPTGGPYPLIVAVRYYFRRAVEADDILFKSVTWGTIDQISQSQARGFEALEEHGRRLEALLVDVREIVVDTHADVLDIKAEQNRQGGQIDEIYQSVQHLLQRSDQLDRRLLRPTDSLSFRNDDERHLVKALVGRFRALPEARQSELPALLNGLGKLEVVVGEFEDAGRDFRAVATTVTDPRAQAEAHHNAYLAALTGERWDEALGALKQAIALDGSRFAPFPTDKYEPDRILGAGGFGVAFLCRNRFSGARVVIKALMTEVLDHDIASVFAEARFLAELKHPAIISLLDCDYFDADTPARPYLILDFFDGRTLEEYVETEGPLTIGDLAPLARTIAEALDAAHKLGIWHGDVKPRNILIRREGQIWHVKLIDFGLAIRRNVIERSIGRDCSIGQTLLGGIAGTIDYAAPEQMGRLTGVEIGSHSDIYSFGKMCYYALFGTSNPHFNQIRTLSDWWRRVLTDCVSESVAWRPPSFTLILEGNHAYGLPFLPPADSDTKSPSRYYTIGDSERIKGDLDSALFWFNRAIESDPSYFLYYNGLGEVHLARGAFNQAITNFTEAIRLNPGSVDAYNNRGNAHKAMGDHHRANPDFEIAKVLKEKSRCRSR